MKGPIKQLDPTQISSEVFIIAPTQIEYIANLFGDAVADTMNMRTFSGKIKQLAEESLRNALRAAKKQALNPEKR